MFCGSCGNKISEQTEFCPACGARNELYRRPTGGGIENELNKRREEYMSAYTRDNRSESMPVLSEGEQVVKSYNCANVRFPRCNGYLTVTNKRVIFHASAATSNINKEVQLESVSGLDCYTGTNINFFGILIALAEFLGSIVMANATYRGGGKYVFIGLLIAAVITYLSIQKTYFLKVFSSKANNSPISLGAGVRNLAGNEALYTLRCRATNETTAMVMELGALISDLQTLGDHAIDKWKK